MPGSSSEKVAGPSQLPQISADSFEPPLPPASIDPARQYQLSRAYRKLHDDIIADGLYEPKPLWRYRFELVRYALLFAGFVYFYATATRQWHVYLSALCLGAFWHQVTFTAHDLGHSGVTGSYLRDRVLGVMLTSGIGGLSISWWADNHNIHHLVTNHPEHDPDIQHIPLFAISSRFVEGDGVFSTYYRRQIWLDPVAQVLLPIQHRIYYFVMSLARFNLFVNSYVFLLTKAPPGFVRNLESGALAFFWTWFGAVVHYSTVPGAHWSHKLGFVMLSFMVTSPVHVQIVLSHFGQDTSDLGIYEGFAHRQLRTTMDVSCPKWLEFIHGGLNHQVSHHLFPRLPRHSLPQAVEHVRRFCAREGLDYRQHSFVKGNADVLRVMRDIGDQVRLMKQVCQKVASGELEAH